MYIQTQLNKGQSLVEVVVAVGVVMLLVTGLIVGSTASIKGSEFSVAKSRALKYSQEGIEISRSLRDQSWATFASRSGLWCLAKDGTWTQASGSCPINIDATFTRGVTFTWDGLNNRMSVTASVTWNDGNGIHTSQLVTYFTQWK